MKKTFTIISLILAMSSFAQSPEAISYQVVARDASGNLLTSQPVSFRLSILQGSPLGACVYCEIHAMTTNSFGVAVVEIGHGTVVSGNFSTIDWGNNEYFLQTEIDPTGGSSYQFMGTTQFLSVPYAKYATTAGNGIPAGTSGQTLRNDGTEWVSDDHLYNDGMRVGIGTTSPAATAAFEVNSSTSGVLLPRITKGQRDAITSPAEGLLIFCTNCGTDGSLSIYSAGTWKTFTPCHVVPPVAGMNVQGLGQITWNWNTVSGAAGYKWNNSTNYETATDMGSNTSKTETGTVCNTIYNRYVWAYSTCGVSDLTTLTETTPAAGPDAPAAGTHVSALTSIVWNWNTVTGALGYKWNTNNDSGTATDMGTATTKSEPGLTCGTAYTRYVWAYNGCGYSTPVTLSQSTLACWICGDPLIINHVAGDVAPVTKTVTYSTVSNIPGATSKCWITSNLGADHQASAVNDATEASAGWYWQFNRKQGYKHDGTTRTPATTWINSISESLHWTTNDPCTIELGTGWRIPTNTEWTNVDASGGWTNWNGPWNSALKLHAAGDLYYLDGSLVNRGSYGLYWGSIYISATLAEHLTFSSGNSNMDLNNKPYAFTLRCLKD